MYMDKIASATITEDMNKKSVYPYQLRASISIPYRASATVRSSVNQNQEFFFQDVWPGSALEIRKVGKVFTY